LARLTHDDRVSYGHGIAVTPLHLASAYAALVNGGIWRPATLSKVDPAHLPPAHVSRPQPARRMRQLLRMIVADGTGRKADARGLPRRWQTGSARQKPGAAATADLADRDLRRRLHMDRRAMW